MTIEKKYVVAKVDEVGHFTQRMDKLFCDYVKKVLYLKQQATGYPSNVITDADKASYIREYYEKEGIRLDPEKMNHNPTQRSINKLLINSLWRSFSMREDLAQTALVKDPEDFTTIVSQRKGCGFDSQGTHVLTKKIKMYSLNAL